MTLYEFKFTMQVQVFIPAVRIYVCELNKIHESDYNIECSLVIVVIELFVAQVPARFILSLLTNSLCSTVS